jgi:hypothetical protein
MKGKGWRMAFFILLIIVVAAAIYFFAPKKTVVTPTETEDTSVDKTPAFKDDAVVNSSKSTITKNEKYYTISAEYPVLSSKDVSKEVIDLMNKTIKNNIEEKIAVFVSDNSSSSGVSTNLPDKSSFGTKYKVYVPAHGLQTIAFDIGESSAGAAHPNSYVYTITFDISTGKELSITDLCESDCLNDISKKAQISLAKVLKQKDAQYDDWAKEGSSAIGENYQVFIVTQESLDIVYNPYQVAAYVFGHIRVPVLWNNISAVLKKEYK